MKKKQILILIGAAIIVVVVILVFIALRGRDVAESSPTAVAAVAETGFAAGEKNPPPAVPTTSPATVKPTSPRAASESNSSKPKIVFVVPAHGPDPPLAQGYSSLVERMNAGDADAASQLARGLSYCSQWRDLGASMASIAKALDPSRTDLTAQDRTNLQRNFDAMQDQLSKGGDQSFCNGLDATQLDTFMPTALIAGQLGDKGAADCFVGIGSQYANSPHMDSRLFAQSALDMANDAIEQGDWAMVRLLSNAYGNAPNRQYLTQVLPKDPVQRYRLLKLERLGTPGYAPNQPDGQLAALAQGLSKDDLNAADAWAQSTYQTNFAGTSALPAGESPDICTW